MTTTDQPDGSSWRDWSEWWAHVEPLAWFGLLSLGLVMAAWLPVVSGWAWPVVSAVAALAIIINSGKHDSRLCSRCAAKTPLNPERAVRRARWVLWLYHRSLLTFGLGMGFALAAWFAPPDVGGWSTVGVFAVLSLIALIDLMHRRARWWCPYCPRWGGGDDGPEEVAPTPRPTPVGVKQA